MNEQRSTLHASPGWFARLWRAPARWWQTWVTPYPSHSPHAEFGRRGERIALKHLKSMGYRILGRNVVVPMGEADAVCLAPDRRTIVIVEIKTRRRGVNERSDDFAPERALTHDKRITLARIARHLARANGWNDRPVRIDAVGVEFHTDNTSPVVRHTPDIC